MKRKLTFIETEQYLFGISCYSHLSAKAEREIDRLHHTVSVSGSKEDITDLSFNAAITVMALADWIEAELNSVQATIPADLKAGCDYEAVNNIGNAFKHRVLDQRARDPNFYGVVSAARPPADTSAVNITFRPKVGGADALSRKLFIDILQSEKSRFDNIALNRRLISPIQKARLCESN